MSFMAVEKGVGLIGLEAIQIDSTQVAEQEQLR
jgi:hypothetical protein